MSKSGSPGVAAAPTAARPSGPNSRSASRATSSPRAARRVVLAEKRPHEPGRRFLLARRERHDYDRGVEGAYGLHPEQFEAQLRVHRLLERLDRRHRAAAQLTGLGSHTLGFPHELPAVGPRQHHPGPAPPAREAPEFEVLKLQPSRA